MMLRQLHFSELDLVLHSQYKPREGATVFDSEVVKRVEERTTILKPLPEDRPATFTLCTCCTRMSTVQAGPLVAAECGLERAEGMKGMMWMRCVNAPIHPGV